MISSTAAGSSANWSGPSRPGQQLPRRPLRAELDTAAALLTAAGIQTRVDLPEDEGPEAAPEPLRSALRSGTARLLGDDAVRECVITIYRRAGRVELDMSGDGIPVAFR